MKYHIRHISYWFLRVLIGIILLSTGVGKAADVPGFVSVIRTYETGLIYNARWVVAILIVVIEIALGLSILFGWRIKRGALLSVLLNAGYFIFLSITLLRGVYVPNCGCFGVFLAASGTGYAF